MFCKTTYRIHHLSKHFVLENILYSAFTKQKKNLSVMIKFRPLVAHKCKKCKEWLVCSTRDCYCSTWLYKCAVTLFKAQALFEVLYSSFFRPSVQGLSFIFNQQPAVRAATDSWPVITPEPHPAGWLLRVSWYACYKIESGKKSFAKVPRDLYLCTTNQSKHWRYEPCSPLTPRLVSPFYCVLHFRL